MSLCRGNDVVRGSLNWGPFTWLNGVAKTYGWRSIRRSSYADGFHTYTLEWTEKFIRVSVDTRLHSMIEISFNKPFFDRGDFPPFVANASRTLHPSYLHLARRTRTTRLDTTRRRLPAARSPVSKRERGASEQVRHTE